ncbi:MAG: hypothetical protein IJV15_14465 [Lachnospiraceae bacterium]|nr:hypothetical protein [Lachnospiraceae bacterium]
MMKKKLFTLLLATTILMVGCGTKKETTTTETTEATTEMTTTEATTEAEKEKSLDDLAKYLVDGGYVSGEQSETMYSYIGAIGGFKYLDSNVEVYEYDETSDTYKEIVNTNAVSGLTVPAINGPYVLIFSNGTTDQNVIDAFNNY